MKCPFCGKENDEQAKICVQCYAAIPHEDKEEKPVTRKRKSRGELNGT